MNPLTALNAEIIEDIFRYLSAKDLLKSSLVSKSWYDFIADSKKCMKKIKIKISNERFLLDKNSFGIDCVKKSKRRYENMMMYQIFQSKLTNDSFAILSNPGRQWKRIKMQEIDLSSRENFQIVMENAQNYVEILHLEQFKFKDSDVNTSTQCYTCPKLKELTLISCQFFNDIFINTNSLTTLNLTSNYGLVKATTVDAFQKLFSHNQHLKILCLCGNITTQIFCDDISKNITFQLKEFKVSNYISDKFHNRAEVENNFNLFLKTQIKLEKIFLGEWMGIPVVETVFNEMKFLKDLTVMELAKATSHVPVYINGLEEPEVARPDVFSFIPNPSILKIDYQDIRGNIFTMKSLVEAAPNLLSLSTYSMNQEMLVLLAEITNKLEYLSVSFFDARNIDYHPIFPKLQEFASLRLDERLILKMMLKTPEARNHFENIIFECFIEKYSRDDRNILPYIHN
ncbi:unnamed protein product [Diamesa serratosioi]